MVQNLHRARERDVWPRAELPFNTSGTALVVIDLTRPYLPDGSVCRALAEVEGEGDGVEAFNERMRNVVLPAVRELLTIFRERELPVFFTREGSHYRDLRDLPLISRAYASDLATATGIDSAPALWLGSEGGQIIDEVAPLPSEVVIDKPGFSIFSGSTTQTLLAQQGADSLVICGITTSCCVESSVRAGADGGFTCVVVESAVADFDAHAHDASVRAIDLNFGRVVASPPEVAVALDSGRIS